MFFSIPFRCVFSSTVFVFFSSLMLGCSTSNSGSFSAYDSSSDPDTSTMPVTDAFDAAGDSSLLSNADVSDASDVVSPPGDCAKNTWCVVKPVPQSNTLYSIWGRDANNVWAVGDKGTILKWDGTQWQTQTSTTMKTLRSIWGDANDVWAVGAASTILKWSGSQWQAQANTATADLYGIGGVVGIDNNLWAVGDNGTILRGFNHGTIWMPEASSTRMYLKGIWSSDANTVWAVGEETILKRTSSLLWAAQASSESFNRSLFSVWSSSASDVWIVGVPLGLKKEGILHYDGSAWSLGTEGIRGLGIWGTSSKNIWVVGEGGTISRWDGTKWNAESSSTSKRLYGVWGSSANDVWAVGEGGVIVRRIGN